MTDYLIKSVSCFSILYVCYIVFFRNSRNYHINRVVLLFSVLFSLSVPSLNIGPVISRVPALANNEYLYRIVSYANYSTGSESVINAVDQGTSTNLSIAILAIYVFISFVLFLRFCIHICVLILKSYQAEKINHKGNKLALIDETVGPFTFFTTIFICRTSYQSKNVEEELILHEIAHKQQLHSIDVVIMEVVQIFFWFNPLVYLFKKLIKANHEYLADDFVLKSGVSHRDYSNKLLSHTFQDKTSRLVSGFNHLLIKNRLLMLAKFNQKRRPASQLAVFVPLVMILFFTTAFKNTDTTSALTLKDNRGFFYADTLFWSEETRKIWLKGKLAVKFGTNDFKGGGEFSGFGEVHLLFVDGQKISPNTSIVVSGKKCEVVILTKEEGAKKYGPEGKLGAVEIYSSK